MIYLTGDLHGDLEDSRLDFFNTLKEDDILICLGDFGYNWSKYTLEHFNLPCLTLSVLGNHENYNFMNTYKVEKLFGGKVRKLKDRVYFLLNGELYNIEGNKFLVFGGADSIDKLYRTPYVSWWPDEIPTQEDFQKALSNIRNSDNIDYFLTHTCPTKLLTSMFKYKDSLYDATSKMIDEIEKELKNKGVKKHCFGHHHKDINRAYYRCFYKDVVELSVI